MGGIGQVALEKAVLTHNQIMREMVDLLENDEQRMRILAIVNAINLPDCYVAAGFLRNLVWDSIHSISTPLNDVDVIFYDEADTDNHTQIKAENFLRMNHPSINWEVKNQAFMHIRNGDAPYKSLLNAISYWPEKETAVGASLNSHGGISIISAFGLDSLFNGYISYNSKRSKDIFINRVQSKHWLKIWPKLQIVL